MQNTTKRLNYCFNNSGIFHIYMYVNAGSIYERGTNNGISHLLEHMMFKNKGRYSQNMSKSLSFIGGRYNAVTMNDVTYYFIKTNMDNYEKAIGLISQFLSFPSFTTKELENEKKIVYEEIIQYFQDFEWRVGRMNINSIISHDNPYFADVGGSVKNLFNITKSDLHDYFKSQYGQQMFFINCDVRHKHAVKSMCEARLGKNITLSLSDARLLHEAESFDPKVILLKYPIPQNVIKLNFVAFPASNIKDNIVLELIAYILTRIGLYSLLNYELREKKALVYTVTSYVSSFRYMGVYNVNITTSNKNVHDVIETALKIMFKLTRGTLDKRLFTYYKKSFKDSNVLTLSNQDYVSEWLGMSYFYEAVSQPQEYIDMIGHITMKDVQDVACKVFDVTKMGIVVVGDFKNIKKVETSIGKLINKMSKKYHCNTRIII